MEIIMNEKYLVGSVAIIVLGIIQITALLLGIDGQVMIILTNAIIAIISYLLGVDITQKKIIRENTTDQTQQDTHSV